MGSSCTRKNRLAREIRYELDQLQRMAAVATDLSRIPPEDRRPWDAAAAAKYVADLFLGLENLCKCRYRYLGVRPPSGSESHGQTLQDFLEVTDLGGRLSAEEVLRLKKYLRFRHRFAHGYGHQVTWEMAEEPLRLLPETVNLLAAVWQNWASHLPEEP